jgi:hypothetical protein
MPVEKLEAAVDTFMVGDGDEVHPARFGEAIDRFRVRIGIRD